MAKFEYAPCPTCACVPPYCQCCADIPGEPNPITWITFSFQLSGAQDYYNSWRWWDGFGWATTIKELRLSDLNATYNFPPEACSDGVQDDIRCSIGSSGPIRKHIWGEIRTIYSDSWVHHEDYSGDFDISFLFSRNCKLNPKREIKFYGTWRGGVFSFNVQPIENKWSDVGKNPLTCPGLQRILQRTSPNFLQCQVELTIV